MKIMWVVDIIFAAIYIYFIFLHEYFLGKRKFKCLRCGRCCRLIVNPSEKEIRRIKKLGYKDFLTKDNKLKRIDDNCVFLTCKNGMCSCKLHNSAKPQICKNFPKKKGIFGKEYDARCKSFRIFKKKSV